MKCVCGNLCQPEENVLNFFKAFENNIFLFHFSSIETNSRYLEETKS